VEVILFASSRSFADVLSVGPGKKFASIEDANNCANAGDTILVYPRDRNRPYEKVAIFVRQNCVTFKAAIGKDGNRVKLSGRGFDYSSKRGAPRAIFQFNKGADGCILEGFELFGASNTTYNGAGVRINQANNILMRNCHIHDNEMGIMSNGDGTRHTARNQRIEHSLIHSNGTAKEPGYNHNLYLGGTSVTLSACEIHTSFTGHNIKSRAHHTRIEYCFIHDSANREIDLVDHRKDTTRPDSHALLIGNIIVKGKACWGNRAVIHFGQDGGYEHDGTIYLIHNTIVTPYTSPAIQLSTSKAKAYLANNIVWDYGFNRKNMKLVGVSNGANAQYVKGIGNMLSRGFIGTGTDMKGTIFSKRGYIPPFANSAKKNFRLAWRDKLIVDQGVPWSEIILPSAPGASQAKKPTTFYQYKHPLAKEDRPDDGKPDIGAYEFKPRD
jgi:hypothetical protein